MKLYIDLVYLLNCYLDFLLLLSTKIILKRNSSLKRLIMGTFVGGFSILYLFISMSPIVLFVFKIILAILMVIVSFQYENLKYTFYNFIYFYMISIILGGVIYYLNMEFKYSIIGIYLNRFNININILFLILFSPIILFFYIKQEKRMKSNYNLEYKVKIVLKDKKEYILNGFLDTGNKLVDPVSNKPIILLEKGILKEDNKLFYYIPFNSLNNHNLLKCLKPEYIEIANKKYKNYLIGICDKKFNMEGVKCILNNKLMEEI